MSLLWLEQLRVVLAPHQLVLLRLGRSCGWHGLQTRIMEQHIIEIAHAADATPWHAVLHTLEAELERMQASGSRARVILSDHFMRYTLLPWSEALSDAAEEEAYARHSFRQLYGAEVAQWEVRLSAAVRPAQAQVASAVAPGLLADVRGVFARNGIRLTSIQPRLMAAYNSFRPALQGRSAWLALYEPGCLCLALLQDDSWASVRTLRIGRDWPDKLLLLLEREAFAGATDAATQQVFLWAPVADEVNFPHSPRWQIHLLQPLLRPELREQADGRYALALSG